MILSLRLTNDNENVDFQSTLAELRRRLSDAFFELQNQSHMGSAILEVYHTTHGWNRVCINNQYPIISNTFTLDYEVLQQAIVVTLAECDRWPTEAQKAQRKAELLAQERDLSAQARRKQFVVLTHHSNT